MAMFGHFRVIFTCFLGIWQKHIKINKFNGFDSSVFDIIQLFDANHVKLLILICFVLGFESPLFGSFWFVLRNRIPRFDSVWN